MKCFFYVSSETHQALTLGVIPYLQFTTNIMRLLTVGGTPLLAMHKYAPMWWRLTRGMTSEGPSAEKTGKEDQKSVEKK